MRSARLCSSAGTRSRSCLAFAEEGGARSNGAASTIADQGLSCYPLEQRTFSFSAACGHNCPAVRVSACFVLKKHQREKSRERKRARARPIEEDGRERQATRDREGEQRLNRPRDERGRTSAAPGMANPNTRNPTCDASGGQVSQTSHPYRRKNGQTQIGQQCVWSAGTQFVSWGGPRAWH